MGFFGSRVRIDIDGSQIASQIVRDLGGREVVDAIRNAIFYFTLLMQALIACVVLYFIFRLYFSVLLVMQILRKPRLPVSREPASMATPTYINIGSPYGVSPPTRPALLPAAKTPPRSFHARNGEKRYGRYRMVRVA